MPLSRCLCRYRSLIGATAVAALGLFTGPSAVSLQGGVAEASAPPVVGGGAAPLAAVQWADLTGRVYSEEDVEKAPATVFFFVSAQCPLAGRYTPRLLDLGKYLIPRGVRCFLVDSNPGDSRAALTAFVAERGIPFPTVDDDGFVLSDHLGATISPEAAVLDQHGRLAYIGRIDDNADRDKVTSEDLRSAVDSVLDGKPVRHAHTRAFGCGIGRESLAKAGAAHPTNLTYISDIAPILNANCISCHHTGAVGPFALDSYEQASLWSRAMKDFTARRQMPPWKALPEYGGPFADCRYLSDTEIATLAGWADGGAPMGTLVRTQPPATRTEEGAPSQKWTLGQPDLVLSPSKSYHLSAEGRDVYRDYALPATFAQDQYISGIEFKPGNPAAIHHMVVYIDRTGESASLDGAAGDGAGWRVTGGGSGLSIGEWADVWTAGMKPRMLPEGVGIRIPAGCRLVLQMHYHKTGKPEDDLSTVGIYFSKGNIQHTLRTVPVACTDLDIAPGVKDQQYTAEDILPCDATLWQIFPHMHMIGTEMKVTATLPDGTERPLVYVKHWDFGWQMCYRFADPVHLPQGTKIKMVAHYDNSATNPFQPSNPPRRVRFGDQITDEMCSVFLGLTDDHETPPLPAASPIASNP